MAEYTANLSDLRDMYITHGYHTADEQEARGRAFDRLIRQIQDEAHEEGYNQRGWEDED